MYSASDKISFSFGGSPKLRVILRYFSDITGGFYCAVVNCSISSNPILSVVCNSDSPPFLSYKSNPDIPDFFMGGASFSLSEDAARNVAAWLQKHATPKERLINVPSPSSQAFVPAGMLDVCRAFAGRS